MKSTASSIRCNMKVEDGPCIFTLHGHHACSQLDGPLLVGRNKEINNQHRAIRREFQSVGLTLLKNPVGAWWGLLPTLQWVGSWLPTYMTSIFFPLSSREKISQWESNHQPLHLEMGTCPLSPGSLGSSLTSSPRI